MHIYNDFYNDFSAPPRYGAMFQALYSQNGCIDLDVFNGVYTVEKLI